MAAALCLSSLNRRPCYLDKVQAAVALFFYLVVQRITLGRIEGATLTGVNAFILIGLAILTGTIVVFQVHHTEPPLMGSQFRRKASTES